MENRYLFWSGCIIISFATALTVIYGQALANITTALFVQGFMVLSVGLYRSRHFRLRGCLCFWNAVRPGETSVTTVCLGRPFKLGMLYASFNDSLFPLVKKTLWTHWNIKKYSTTHENTRINFDVITDDSLSNKLRHLGVKRAHLALNLLSGLVKTTSARSTDYLQDTIVSNRQVRVVLKYQCVTKYRELNMPWIHCFSKTCIFSPDEVVPTHVVVGVEYGAEAYFVFDKDLGNYEDYQETRRLMESLISYLPDFKRNKKTLTEEEKALSKQLRYTLYSDIPIKNPESFEEIIEIYDRILPGFAAMGNVLPIKAWLCPLYLCTDSKVQTAEKIEQSFMDQIVETFDRLHSSELKVNHWLDDKVCDSFDCLLDQLKELCEIINLNQSNLCSNLQRFVQARKRKRRLLEDKITKIINQSISIENFLNAKEKEVLQISEYLALLKSAEIPVIPSQNNFNFYASNTVGSYYIICLEFQLNAESQDFDPEEISDHYFASDVKSKIEKFISFAHDCHESKYVATASTDASVLQQDVVIRLYRPNDRQHPEVFNFPVPVEKPFCSVSRPPSWDKITIEWGRPQQTEQPIGYAVFFKQTDDKAWDEKYVEGDTTIAKIGGLKAKSAYVFKVVTKFRYGHSSSSTESDKIITHEQPLKIKITKDSTLSEEYTGKNCSKKIWKIRTKLNYDEQITTLEFGRSPLSTKHTKVVMAMGATGAGKSTLINAMVNYVLGVNYDDDFQFILICDETSESQAHSQTSAIAAYTLYWQEGFNVPYNLLLIDTPGFGDTRGIEQDEETLRQLNDLLNGIDHIHAIMLVVQASLARLTASQKYIFTSVLSLFAKDITENVVIMATHADKKLTVLDALKEDKVPHSKVFQFNNSALYADDYDKMTEFHWEKSFTNMETFFNYLVGVSDKSLKLTVEVLNQRKQLEMILNGLHPKIELMSTKAEALRTEEELLKNREDELASNKDFTYTVKVTKQRKKDLPKTGIFVTNCAECSFTCHYPCSISDDGEKYDCSAMTKDGPNAGKCTVCPKKCSWDLHSNNTYFFEYYEDTEQRTSKYLREQYNISANSKKGAENAIKKLQDELDDLSRKIYAEIHEARCCKVTLSALALRANPMTDAQYIDQLIEGEKQENKTGFQRRIELYINMKKKAVIMESCDDKEIRDELQKKDKGSWLQIIWTKITGK